MMRKRVLSLFTGAVMLLALLSACTGTPAEEGAAGFDDGYGENVLRISLDSEIESADVQLTTADYLVPLNIFDTLVAVESKADGTSEIVPALAESWDVSPDGLVYTFHLREGVTFHNGETFEADDVLYTIERMGNPQRLAKNTDCMSMISGFQAMLDGETTTVAGVGVNVIDSLTVELVLEQAYAPFLANLCVPGFSIYNREAGDAADEAGGGMDSSKFGAEAEYPFILKDWQLNDHIYLEANPNYWNGAAALDGILVKIIPDSDTRKMMFESGQLDIFDLDSAPEQIPYYTESEEWSDQVVEGPRVATYYFSLNQAIAPLEDVRVRQAIQMAIDRQGILDSLYGGAGSVAHGIFSPGMVGYNTELPEIPYDVEAAKALLADAGYADGFEMHIAQTASSDATTKSLYQIIQAQLAEVGITVVIDPMDDASWMDVRLAGELPSFQSYWAADFNDPDNFIYTYFTTANTVSRSFNYADQAVMDRVEAARYMVDQDARVAEYQDLEIQIIQTDAAWVPLFHPDHILVVSERVENMVPHWAGWSDNGYYQTTLSVGEATE